MAEDTRRRRRLAIGVAVVVVLAGGGIAYWKLGGDDPPPKPYDPWASPVETGPSDAEILAAKRAARRGAPVDVTPGTIAGTVTRAADGTGVAGAVVAIDTDQIGGDDLPGADVRERGHLAIADATGAWTAAGVAPGRYVVTAASPGLLPAAKGGVALAAGASVRGVDLALAAGGVALRGTVSDIGGGPIADARVRVVTSDDFDFTEAPRTFVAISRDDGTYEHTLPAGTWRATATHADYTAVKKDVELRDKPVTADFTLTPGASIAGRVVASADGTPVPGARVIAQGGRSGAASERWGGGEAQAVVADDAGRFTIGGLGSGAIALTASGKGFASTAPTVVQLGIGEAATDVDVLVDRAVTVSGFVVKKADKKTGIAGVLVGIFSLSGGGHQHMAQQPSGDDGYFEIHGVQPETYLGFAAGSDVMPELGQTILVKDQDVTDVLIVMDTGVTLSGRVEPPAVTRLGLEMDESKLGIGNIFQMIKSQFVRTRSGADGAFAAKHAPAGEFTLVARADDGRIGQLPVVIGDTDQTGLVIRLEPRASIEGTVVDAGGKPVPGVDVTATPAAGGDLRAFRSAMFGSNTAATGADGAFRIVGLDAGAHTVAVSDDHGPLALTDAPDPAEARRGKPIDVPAAGLTGVVLRIEARDGVIRGVVVDAARKPVADAWVTATFTPPGGAMSFAGVAVPDGAAEQEDTVVVEGGDDRELPRWSEVGPQPPVLTGPDGRFTITGLRRGKYQVVAEGDRGSARARKAGVKTGDSVTLVLEKLGSLTGVVTAAGAPARGYTINCDGPTDEHSRRVLAADGAYAFERLPPGTYKCTVEADAGTASGEATVKNEVARLDLALGAWGAVTGRIVDGETGAPRAGLKVMVSGLGERTSDMAAILTGGGPTTDANGGFTIERLTAGTGSLMAFDGASAFMPLVTREVTLAPGQRLDLGTLEARKPPDPNAPTSDIPPPDAAP
jgi:hypothetical protein